MTTLRWAAPSDADVDTDYVVYRDTGAGGAFESIVTQDSTSDGGSYAAYTTTLSSALTDTATAVSVTDATNFAQGNYIVIGGETILLGTKAGSTFSGCTRGVGGSVAVAHDNGSTVYKAHESYTDSYTPPTRNIVRYRITRVQGVSESIPSESTVVFPSSPPNSDYVTVYGVVRDIQGNVISGASVSLSVSGSGNYSVPSGSAIAGVSATTTTDSDGYFELFVLKDTIMRGTETLSLTVSTTGASTLDWSVTSVPDVVNVNFLEV